MHAEHCSCAHDSVVIDMKMFLDLAPTSVKKELRQIIGSREAAAAPSSDGSDSEEEAASCSQHDEESAGSVSAAESAANSRVESEQASKTSARVPEQRSQSARAGRKRVLATKQPPDPSSKRQRKAPARTKRVTSVHIAAETCKEGSSKQPASQPAGRDTRACKPEIVAAKAEVLPPLVLGPSSSRPVRLASAGVGLLMKNLQAMGHRRNKV